MGQLPGETGQRVPGSGEGARCSCRCGQAGGSRSRGRRSSQRAPGSLLHNSNENRNAAASASWGHPETDSTDGLNPARTQTGT